MSQSSSMSLKNKSVTSTISSQLPVGFWKSTSTSTSCAADTNRKRMSTSTAQEEPGETLGYTRPLALPVLQVLLEFRHEPIAYYR